MAEYPSNSDKAREESKFNGEVTKRKKNELQKFAERFISEDSDNIENYIFSKILMPYAKKALADIANTLIDMIPYGDSLFDRKANNRMQYWKGSEAASPMDRDRPSFRVSNYGVPDFDDILFKGGRAEAEEFLEVLRSVIRHYGTLSIDEMYDRARIPNDNYALRDWGWRDLSGAYTMRVQGGYIIKMPRPICLKQQ